MFSTDIKPENVMCQTSKSTNIKIIDFGLATKLDPNELVKISTGTAEFAAPEIVEREPVGFYTDMWSIGVLAYVLLSGLSPFAGATDIDTLKNVKVTLDLISKFLTNFYYQSQNCRAEHCTVAYLRALDLIDFSGFVEVFCQHSLHEPRW